jgi:hypothetical protein
VLAAEYMLWRSCRETELVPAGPLTVLDMRVLDTDAALSRLVIISDDDGNDAEG